MSVVPNPVSLIPLTLNFLSPVPSASLFVPCWYFCYLLQLKATGPWCDWAAVFSMLELVFYNATHQGQTWWITPFHYCHLKDCSLEEEGEEGEYEGRKEVSKQLGGWRKGEVAWLTECQINCISFIQGPTTPVLVCSPHLAFHELLYVSFSFLNWKAIFTVIKYWGKERWWEENKGMQREKKRRQNPSRQRHCKSRHLTRGGGSTAPLIITDTLHYPHRNVHRRIHVHAFVSA